MEEKNPINTLTGGEHAEEQRDREVVYDVLSAGAVETSRSIRLWRGGAGTAAASCGCVDIGRASKSASDNVEAH